MFEGETVAGLLRPLEVDGVLHDRDRLAVNYGLVIPRTVEDDHTGPDGGGVDAHQITIVDSLGEQGSPEDRSRVRRVGVDECEGVAAAEALVDRQHEHLLLEVVEAGSSCLTSTEAGAPSAGDSGEGGGKLRETSGNGSLTDAEGEDGATGEDAPASPAPGGGGFARGTSRRRGPHSVLEGQGSAGGRRQGKAPSLAPTSGMV